MSSHRGRGFRRHRAVEAGGGVPPPAPPARPWLLPEKCAGETGWKNPSSYRGFDTCSLHVCMLHYLYQ
jgi:hypothetical protein